VHQGFVQVDPFAAVFTIGRAGDRGEIGQHSADAEAVDKSHRSFEFLDSDVRMAQDLICSDVRRLGAGGGEMLDRSCKLFGKNLRARAFLSPNRCTFEA
jgi:hypothetical protein